MMEKRELLEMSHISKTFPGVKALDDVSLTVKEGTVHAVMGENGAGKSTLMKILMGVHQADPGGEVHFNGSKLDTTNIRKVLEQGIVMIFQELNAIDNMTVAENVYIGREPYKINGLMIDKKKMARDTMELFEELEINNIDPREKVSELSLAKKQMLEIASAVSHNARIIVMDEPTSAITEKECLHLFKIVNKLKAQGVAFVFITHKMDEVFKIADEVTVLRDGRYIATESAADMTTDKLIALMVGREIKQMFPKEEAEIGDVYFEVKNLSLDGVFEDVNFTVRKGEILGIAGLMGSGRTEVMETLFGYRKASRGELYLDGKQISIKKTKDAMDNKIAFLTEERKKDGLFLPLNIRDNLTMLSLGKLRGTVGLDNKRIKEICHEEIEKFAIKTPSEKQIISNLSGGNQQKVLIARWLLTDPDIIILDEPTRGIDVGAKSEIHKIMSGLAKKGKCIIMISSELPEVLGMSDRVVVMHEGMVTGIVDRSEADQESIMRYATATHDQA